MTAPMEPSIKAIAAIKRAVDTLDADELRRVKAWTDDYVRYFLPVVVVASSDAPAGGRDE